MKSILTATLTSLCLPSVAGILTNAPSLIDERTYPLNLPQGEEINALLSETFGITDPTSGLLFSYGSSVASYNGPINVTNKGVFSATFSVTDITGYPVKSLIELNVDGKTTLIKPGYLCITHPCIISLFAKDFYIEVENIKWAYPAPSMSAGRNRLELKGSLGQKGELWASKNLIDWVPTYSFKFTNSVILNYTPNENTFYRTE